MPHQVNFQMLQHAITRKAQLMQRGTGNSGACLKVWCEKSKLTHPSHDVSYTLARGRQMARPVSLSSIGLKSKNFPIPSHLTPSLKMTPLKFMQKLYGS